jgi:transposase-like protein
MDILYFRHTIYNCWGYYTPIIIGGFIMPKHNITNEEKKQLFQRRLNGEAVSVIATDIGVPKSTVYAWLAEARKLRHESAKNQDGSITVEAMDYYQLQAHAKKLEGMLEVIKLVSDISEIPLDKKLQVPEELYHTEKYSVHLMCETLDVPRGTFYNYIKRGKKGNTVASQGIAVLRLKLPLTP